MTWTDEDRTPPMRRIKYEMGHAISGYQPDGSPSYFTNAKAARAAAVEEVGQYLEALGAYDDDGDRIPAGKDGHVSVSKEGDYKWRLTFGMGGSRYVYVDTVDDALYFDDNGEVWERRRDDTRTVVQASGTDVDWHIVNANGETTGFYAGLLDALVEAARQEWEDDGVTAWEHVSLDW